MLKFSVAKLFPLLFPQQILYFLNQLEIFSTEWNKLILQILGEEKEDGFIS